MIEKIRELSQFLDVDPFWIWLLILLSILLGIVFIKYPWNPKYKSKITKDKDGNDVIIHYHWGI